MVSERNRILKLKDYIENQGVLVNIGKNKAQGNKGFFRAKNNTCRIDISKGLNDSETIKTLVHEFAHFIHYKYDNSLESLDFIFKDFNDDITNELIELTVESIGKSNLSHIFNKKNALKTEIKNISSKIKTKYQDFKPTEKYNLLENKIKKQEYKHLLKYDKVKIYSLFSYKIIDINSLSNINEDELDYLRLKSMQRKLKRINSKITRLNRYYNTNTELFARAVELFIINPDLTMQKSKFLYNYFSKIIENNAIPELKSLKEIFK